MDDLQLRCQTLLDALQRARGDWLPLGPVRTLWSPEVNNFARLCFLGKS